MEQRIIKVIWDFRGFSASETAKHHLIHLKEYCLLKKIPIHHSDTETIAEMHIIAFINVDESFTKMIREDLKPHRGQLAT